MADTSRNSPVNDGAVLQQTEGKQTLLLLVRERQFSLGQLDVCPRCPPIAGHDVAKSETSRGYL